jgi:hypothetical protein
MNSNGKGWLILALFVALAAPGLAADSPLAGAAAGDAVLADPQPEPWGGASDTALVIGASGITPPSDIVAWATTVSAGTGIGVFQSSAAATTWVYQFHAPSGALLQLAELEACDTSTTAAITFGITRGVAPAGATSDISPATTTGTVQTPGCAFFWVAPTAATTINNAGNNYWVYINWVGSGFGPSLHLHSIRVYYRLQVSPAPSTATFPNDVPTTHPFFRFVEAMAASGLTGGCSAGSFCPDNPVTRGQLSVFLAAALGLHFPY